MGVITQRAIARRRATLDFISKSQWDSDVIEARQTFIELAKQPGGLAAWADADKEQTREAQKIKLVLNEFELISIGIQRGIIDYELYSRWFKSGTLRFWGHGSPYIHALRARLNNEALFHEFEEMTKWFRDNKMPRRRWLWGYFF